MARLRKARTRDQSRHRQELAEVERSIERCVDYVVSGDGPPGAIRRKLEGLEARKRDLEAILSPSARDIVVEFHPNLPELYRKKVANLADLLAGDQARPEAMEAIRSPFGRIEVRPGEERGKCDVTPAGTLAGILSLAQTNTAARRPSGGTCLLVAGVRYQLCRTPVSATLRLLPTTAFGRQSDKREKARYGDP